MITRPQNDEIEVSLFGPGFGECVVVHLGNDQWMVVDSCLDESRERSIAESYLSAMGINLASQVKYVVVTHWDDDHIRGIGGLFEQAKSARFICSAALRHPEFFELLIAGRHIKLVQHNSGVSEFSKIFQVLQERSPDGLQQGPYAWAQDGTIICRETDGSLASVMALSPSSQTITESMMGLARAFPEAGKTIQRLPARTPNETSVVLLVSLHNFSILLGGDLEVSTNPDKGWNAVISSANRPERQSGGYKIAHHGSTGADADDIWRILLEVEPIATLTPFSKQKIPLPTQEDVERIKARSSKVFITAWPPTVSPKRMPNAVEKTMRDMKIKKRAIRRKPGLIRYRVPASGGIDNCKIELFDGATKLL